MGAIVSKGENAKLAVASTTTSTNVRNDDRTMVYSSDTSYNVGDGYAQSGGSRSANNTICVPIAVYGIQKSGLASSASTLASNCMLSNGDSVEDAIVKHTEVTFTSVTVSGNNKANVGSLTSTLPAGSILVGFNVKSGIDSDMIPFANSGNLMVRNFNSSSITIATAKVDVFYI